MMYGLKPVPFTQNEVFRQAPNTTVVDSDNLKSLWDTTLRREVWRHDYRVGSRSCCGRWPDRQQRRVDAIAQSLPNLAWERVSAGSGSKGERLYDWTPIRGWEEDGWSHGLLVRRSIEPEPEYAYYWFYAPTSKAALESLVRVAGQRWQIEQCFQAAKGECGLDHYEVRHWQGWHRHITLAMLAAAVLAILRARGEKNSSWAGAAQRARTAPPPRSPSLARMARH